MARIQISIDDEVLQKVDAYVKSCGLSRSAFLALAATDYIKAKETAPIITGSFASMANIVNARMRGEISAEDAKQQLDDINESLKGLSGK